jgi:hypothetical protein
MGTCVDARQPKVVGARSAGRVEGLGDGGYVGADRIGRHAFCGIGVDLVWDRVPEARADLIRFGERQAATATGSFDAAAGLLVLQGPYNKTQRSHRPLEPVVCAEPARSQVSALFQVLYCGYDLI